MRTPRPIAFTLIETVLSLGIVGVIAVSMTSIMMLTSRAMPSVRDADVVNVSTREVASRIAAELADATSITGLSARSVTFTVPDRDSDGLEETFRYGWGGHGRRSPRVDVQRRFSHHSREQRSGLHPLRRVGDRDTDGGRPALGDQR